MALETVVVIGGSVAGLLHGLQLKRDGIKVIMLEQDATADRDGHESGVSLGPSTVRLLKKHNDTGHPVSVASPWISFSYLNLKWLHTGNVRWMHNMSNWRGLYLVLRANFDGMASEVIPNPPPARATDGAVEYRGGKRVTSLDYAKEEGIVHVHYVDVKTGKEDVVSSPMVIAADGVHSTVRTLMNVPTQKQYGGYIGWRGTISETLVSKETAAYFAKRLHFSLLPGMYFVSYIIPSGAGDVEHGKCLINWVWYYPVEEDSEEMKTIFTDVNGKLRERTLPQGDLNPEVWKAHVAKYIQYMTPALAEVVTKTPEPFVTKIGEAACTTKSFYDDRVMLVGDAFNAYRPHLGWATEQAARHAWQLEKVLRGEMTVQERNREANYYATKFTLLNRAMGLFGLRWIVPLIQTVSAYVWLVFTHNIGLA